ncbi:MAG: tetratricopeptide repeat protein [Holophagae bacterium]|jgi:tetratricopeptide (TPR) repeat protein
MCRRTTRAAVLAVVVLTIAAVVSAGPQSRVSGLVVDFEGNPIAGATITLTSDELPSFEKSVTTGADGEFRVLILDATKTYLFTVTADGYIKHQEEIKVPTGTMDNEFTFELTTPKQRFETRKQELLEQPGYKEYDEAVHLIEAGQTEQAHERLEAAVAAKPDLIQAYEALASLDFDSGDHELALATARRCLEVDDESLKCLAVAANAAGLLGDSEAEQAFVARYQELNPNDPATLFNQAATFLNKMDDASARPLLEQCLAVAPDFAKCLFEYGMLLLRAGDLEGAKSHLEHYLEVAPDGADADAARETVKYL